MITWDNKFDDKTLHAKSPSTECESLTIDNDYKDPWANTTPKEPCPLPMLRDKAEDAFNTPMRPW